MSVQTLSLREHGSNHVSSDTLWGNMEVTMSVQTLSLREYGRKYSFVSVGQCFSALELPTIWSVWMHALICSPFCFFLSFFVCLLLALKALLCQKPQENLVILRTDQKKKKKKKREKKRGSQQCLTDITYQMPSQCQCKLSWPILICFRWQIRPATLHSHSLPHVHSKSCTSGIYLA